jgi:hypothetical protein
MQQKTIFLILGLLIVTLIIVTAAGAFLFVRPTACGTGDSNYADVWRARTFAFGVFESSQWRNSYAALPFRIDVIWESLELESVVFLEYLLFNCGYTEEDLDEYFSDENFEQIIFIDYDNVQKIGECRLGNLRLYEFHADLFERPYRLSQWVQPDGEQRVTAFLMVFPIQNEHLMRSYATKIFPDLPACP